MSADKFYPGEGFSNVYPSPALALLGHPLPQGERVMKPHRIGKRSQQLPQAQPARDDAAQHFSRAALNGEFWRGLDRK
jgi:hypothetical protein